MQLINSLWKYLLIPADLKKHACRLFQHREKTDNTQCIHRSCGPDIYFFLVISASQRRCDKYSFCVAEVEAILQKEAQMCAG